VPGRWDEGDEELYQRLSALGEDGELSKEGAQHLNELEKRRSEKEWTAGAYSDEDLLSEIDVFLDEYIDEVGRRDEEVQEKAREILIQYVEEI